MRSTGSSGFESSVAYRDNPLTIGRRFDPARLTAALATPFEPSNGLSPSPPLVVATGGYPVRMARERGLLVRSNPWSEGDGIALALERGARGDAERRVLRAGDAGARARSGVRAPRRSSTAASHGASSDVGEEFSPAEGVVVGERPRTGDRRPAGRPRVVRARRRGPRAARGRRAPAVRAGDRAAARRRSPCARLRRGHAHLWRRQGRQRAPVRPTASGRQASTWAACRTAATRAASPRRSCSGWSQPRTPALSKRRARRGARR